MFFLSIFSRSKKKRKGIKRERTMKWNSMYFFCRHYCPFSFYSIPLFLRGLEKEGKGELWRQKNARSSVSSSFIIFEILLLFNVMDPNPVFELIIILWSLAETSIWDSLWAPLKQKKKFRIFMNFIRYKFRQNKTIWKKFKEITFFCILIY